MPSKLNRAFWIVSLVLGEDVGPWDQAELEPDTLGSLGDGPDYSYW